MVKLVTALEARLYGLALAVWRWEYINAGAYMFGTLPLAAGLPSRPRAASAPGTRGVALAVVAAVNAHDLGVLAGVDCHVGLARFDHKLGLVALHATGCVVGLTLQLFSQVHEFRPSARAADALLAGAVLWLLDSMLSSSQSSSAACSSTAREAPRLVREREGRVPVVWRSAAPPTDLR